MYQALYWQLCALSVRYSVLYILPVWRRLNCGEIDCIKGSAMNGLKIVSAGRDIVKFSKALDNCGELIKWARCNHIKIDDDPDADPKKAQNIYMITAVIVMILAVFIGLYLGLKGR